MKFKLVDIIQCLSSHHSWLVFIPLTEPGGRQEEVALDIKFEKE
jgi:hypothetical protein